jgi:hypothetical protein
LGVAAFEFRQTPPALGALGDMGAFVIDAV